MKEAYTVKGVRGAEEFTYSGLQVGAAHVQSPALRLPLLSTPEARTLNRHAKARTLNRLHAITTRYNSPVFHEFQNASYIERYNILGKKLAQEQLYSTAMVLASPREAIATGYYSEISEMTGLTTFVTSFAGHIAAEAARS